MKKRRFLFGLLLAFLTAITFGLKIKNTNSTYAAGIVSITFDANGGECSTGNLQTNEDGTLANLPTPSKLGYAFECWTYEDQAVTTSTVFDEDASITAKYHLKLFSYVISKSESVYSVIGKTANTDFDYTLATDYATIEDCLLAIESDLTQVSNPATISFDNITLINDLALTFHNVTLSGKLNLDSFSINYNTPIANSVFNLKNLILNSTESQNQINISGEHRVSMEITNTEFNNTKSNNNYAIYFENSSNSIVVKEKISHETTYLYNHNKYSSAQMNNIDITEQTNGQLSITTPYDTDMSTVVASNINSSSFNFVPLNNTYTCQLVQNGAYLQVKTTFNITFDANGGEIDDNLLTTQTRYKQSNTIPYPTEDVLTKTHFILNGFAGKIALNSEQMLEFSTNTSVWYFDKTMLNNFLENANDYSEIVNYFSETLPVANNNGFTYYKFDSTQNDLNSAAITLMLDLEQNPVFVALWSDTIYNITFETNGGSSVENISGVYNSIVMLPTTSKSGYTFDGWYSSSEFAEGTLKTSENFSQMPDKDTTLYAKWIADNHSLTIFPNNGQTELVIPLSFNTPLSEVVELANNYFSKTGHSFVAWFEDASLSDDKQITDISSCLMPNENFSVYAKWQINEYTITLNTNHTKDSSNYKVLTANYGADLSELKSGSPSFEGYIFKGWYTSSSSHYNEDFPFIPSTMPAENLTLYASWEKISYKLYYYLNNNTYYYREILSFEDEIVIPNTPVVSGYIFNGWYTNTDLTEEFRLTSMPSHDVYVYAKMIAKKTIAIDQTAQSSEISSNKGFVLNVNLKNFKIEYLVNDKWQIDYPTQKGSYDVRITREEDTEHNAVNIIIEKGFSVVPDSVDIKAYYLFFYIIAVIEIISALIVLFLRKQRQSYLTYAVALPFGLVSNNDFINLIISIILLIFGFVLLVMQYTKLKKLNIEISKISDENKGYKPPDVSTNNSVSDKVDEFLKQEGFESSSKNTDDNFVEIGYDEDEYKETTHNYEAEDNINNISKSNQDIDLDIDRF